MPTRAAAARKAALLLSAQMKPNEQNISDPLVTPQTSLKQGAAQESEANPRKRKVPAPGISSNQRSKVNIGDRDYGDAVDGDTGVSTDLFGTVTKNEEFANSGGKKDPSEMVLPTPLASVKRKRAAPNVKKAGLVNGGWDELPHNLGSVERPEATTKLEVIEDQTIVNGATAANKERTVRHRIGTSQGVKEKVDKLLEMADQPIKKVKKGKANPYGLTPGKSPFPDFVMPTVESCKEVQGLLSEAHGKVEPPKEIPPPSLDVTGCGEVPSVLDAMIRTRLSASTTTTNAKYAFQGLVRQYGILEEGIGKGSVDWNKVRESDTIDIEKAIKRGGLAKTKSISIKSILEMVYEINTARRNAFIREKATRETADVVGVESLTQTQKDMEIEMAEKRILSLQFIHSLDSDKAMTEFVKFPGIGVKTASCIILFCLQRPSFAVDTHVHRLCRWLKWIPPNATRDQAFSHCEVRIPNGMKYSLHQLFIRHGKTCTRCRAATGEGSEEWENASCPIEHLVERTGKRKAAGPSKKNAGDKTSRRGKRAKKASSESNVLEGNYADMDGSEIEDEGAEIDDRGADEDLKTKSALSDNEE